MATALISPVESAKSFLDRIGSLALFIFEAFVQIFHSKRLFRKTMRQMYAIGAESLFVIVLIGLFTGLVLGLQAYYAMGMFGAQGMLGSLLSLTLIREMGPVLAAIMITARAGSAMTAEIGVMRISDQIDALEIMDINPISYMVSPRLLASLISLPLLTCVFSVVGIFGGFLSSSVLLTLSEGRYFAGVESSVTMADVTGSLVKSLVFAVLIIGVCCYQGYTVHTRKGVKGPEAVADATTSAVVMTCVLVLIADYILTSILMNV